ncbi:phosphatidate cytidylyltransferase [bacterium]|nr:phosphatidate cytidylyltransferase [bacterium]
MIQRIITGIVLITVGVVLITLGGLPWFAWLFCVSHIIAHELFQMMKSQGHKTYPWIGHGLIGLLIFSMASPETIVVWTQINFTVLTLGLLLQYIVELATKRLFLSENAMMATFRVVFLCVFTLPYAFLLREMPNGAFHIWICCLAIWASDTFAYFGGRLYGKTPLSSVSPNKTIEGTLTGLVFSGISVGVLCYFTQTPLFPYVPLAVVIAIFAQIGDLHESLTKRTFKVKDSSNLLPGHGGFYDRADSSLFVFPLYFILIQYLL